MMIFREIFWCFFVCQNDFFSKFPKNDGNNLFAILNTDRNTDRYSVVEHNKHISKKAIVFI